MQRAGDWQCRARIAQGRMDRVGLRVPECRDDDQFRGGKRGKRQGQPTRRRHRGGRLDADPSILFVEQRVSGEERTDVTIRADAEQRDVESRRPAEALYEFVLGADRGAFEIGRVSLQAVHTIERHRRRIEPERASQSVVGFRIVGRHGAFVRPEEVRAKPIERLAGKPGEEGPGDGSAGQRHRESAVRRECAAAKVGDAGGQSLGEVRGCVDDDLR